MCQVEDCTIYTPSLDCPWQRVLFGKSWIDDKGIQIELSLHNFKIEIIFFVIAWTTRTLLSFIEDNKLEHDLVCRWSNGD